MLWKLLSPARGGYFSLLRTSVRRFTRKEPEGPQPIQFKLSGVEKLNLKQTWGEWIITTEARKIIGNYIVCGGVCVVTSCLFLFNMYALDFVRYQYSERPAGAPRMLMKDYISGEEPIVELVSPEALRLAAVNYQRAGLTDDQFERVEVFTSSLLDPVVVGTAHSGSGAVVGMPRHLMAVTREQLDLSSYRIKPFWNYFFKGYTIPTEEADPTALEELKDCLWLSPEARSFIVAKSLANTNSYQAAMESFVPGCLIFAHYVYGVNINEKMGLMQRPRPLRLAIQNLWLLTVILVGLVGLSNARRYYEQAAIRRVVRTPAEAQAAVEYYDKCLRRNRLLWQILGPDAAYYFHEDGELEPSFYENPENVSLKRFRDFCQSLAESLLHQGKAETIQGDKDKL